MQYFFAIFLWNFDVFFNFFVFKHKTHRKMPSFSVEILCLTYPKLMSKFINARQSAVFGSLFMLCSGKAQILDVIPFLLFLHETSIIVSIRQ